MEARGLADFDPIDVRSFSRDGSERAVYAYGAVRYELPPGCAAGYMPELNVLCGIADVSTTSGQPVTKHLVVDVDAISSRTGGSRSRRRTGPVTPAVGSRVDTLRAGSARSPSNLCRCAHGNSGRLRVPVAPSTRERRTAVAPPEGWP